MPKCSFCGGPMPEGKGRMFVRKTGQILYFCTSKCKNNWKLGRAGKKKKWTTTSRKEREKTALAKTSEEKKA